jgi:hypothetical protein
MTDQQEAFSAPVGRNRGRACIGDGSNGPRGSGALRERCSDNADLCCRPLSKGRIPLFLQRPERPPTGSKLELTLANSMHEFQPSQSDGCRPMGLEAQHGAASSLDRPMILLYDIVQVLALAYQDVFPPTILSTKSAQTQMTGFVAIQRNFPRPSWCAECKRLAKKGHSRCNTAPGLEQGVHCLALLINGTIQVAHLGPGTNVGLVDPPGRTDRPRAAVPPPLVFGYKPKDPSDDGCMGHVHLAHREGTAGAGE